MSKHRTDAEPSDKLLILNSGSQFAKGIEWAVKGLNVQSVFLDMDTPIETIMADTYKGIIVSGGPKSAYASDAYKVDPQVFRLGIPVLCICYGMQLCNIMHGGQVSKKGQREDFRRKVRIYQDYELSPYDVEKYIGASFEYSENMLFKGLSERENVLLTHGDSIHPTELSSEFRIIGLLHEVVVAMQHKSLPIYGLQFHPEVDMTDCGPAIFTNFITHICQCKASLEPNKESRLSTTISDSTHYIYSTIRQRMLSTPSNGINMDDIRVLALVSGGVDSLISIALLAKSVPVQAITAVFIDTGFMRRNDEANTRNTLATMNIEMHTIHASARFLKADTKVHVGHRALSACTSSCYVTPPLHRCVDPEDKRKVIGDTFVSVLDDFLAEAYNYPRDYLRALSMGQSVGKKEAGKVVFLMQGTLCTDLNETGSETVSGVASKADTIKTHHNSTQLFQRLRHKKCLVEPVGQLGKHEARGIGLHLGLPAHWLNQHPFPGPGYAIRIICTPSTPSTPSTNPIDPFYTSIQRNLDKISGIHTLTDEMLAHDLFLHSLFSSLEVEYEEEILDEMLRSDSEEELPQQRIITSDEANILSPPLSSIIHHSHVNGIKKSYSRGSISRHASTDSADTMSELSSSLESLKLAYSESHMRAKSVFISSMARGFQLTLLPIRSVGVQGDSRSYSYVCAISSQAQDIHAIDWHFLTKLTAVLPRFIQSINRIIFAFGPLITHPINQVVPTYLSHDTIATVSHYTQIVNSILDEHTDLSQSLAQVPVVLIPIDFNNPSAPARRSIVIRPFISNDFTTGRPAIPGKDIPFHVIERIIDSTLHSPTHPEPLSRICIDLTPKPPATLEWE